MTLHLSRRCQNSPAFSRARVSAQCHGPTSPVNVATDRPGLPDISPPVFFIAQDFVRCLSQGLKGSVPLSERGGIYRETNGERGGREQVNSWGNKVIEWARNKRPSASSCCKLTSDHPRPYTLRNMAKWLRFLWFSFQLPCSTVQHKEQTGGQ